MSRTTLCCLFAAFIGLLFCPLPAPAQVVLKPNGRDAVPLRTRSVDADITLDHQFAATRLTLTFLNETSDRIEADFIYALPPNTLVTSFAYWYGDEKVVARVVEKEEAAAIYAHITARMHDPALVEMVGKHTFRARIFPVMPNADLKVEMTLVEAMPSGRNGASYTLPLRMDRGSALDKVAVHVRVKPDPDLAKVTNNIGLPVTQSRDGYRIALAGSNYRPQQDLRVDLIRKAQPLHASLYAARMSGRDGFFALALTPDRTLIHPQVRITGVTTYQVLAPKLSAVGANQALTLFGLYTGSGPAKVTLTGTTAQGNRTYAQVIHFGLSREPDNLAAKLWAARYMEQLSADLRNREIVIALSRRFGMPSRFTSWLAVPKAEMERYKEEQLEARIEVVAHRLAAQVSAGRENSQVARRLERQLRSLCGQNRSDPRDALRAQLYAELDGLASAMAAKIAAGQENTPAGRHLRARLNTLCRLTNTQPQDQMQGYLDSTLSALSRSLVEIRNSDKPDAARIASLRRQLYRIARASGESVKDYMDRADADWTYYKLQETRDRLLAEHRKDRPDAAHVRKLERQFLALTTKYGGSKDYAEVRLKRLAVRAETEKVNHAIEDSGKPANAIQLADLKRLQQQEDELRMRMGDPLISIEAPADAQQVVALMPGGEIKRLAYNAHSRRWEARFDIPSYAKEGEYAITVVIVLRDGTRKTLTVRYQVDITPPTGSGRAQIVSDSRSVLRLQLDAGEDTARVKALLPWGELVELKPTAQPHRFFALASIPAAQRGAPSVVKFILTDRAHNRTSILVDMMAN